MIRPLHQEHFDSSDTSTGSDVGDPLQLMLRDIGSIPMLTVEEEHQLANQIRAAKQEYRNAMLQWPGVIPQCVKTLHNVVAGKLRLDRVLNLSLSDTRGKTRLRKIVATNLITLDGFLSESEGSKALSDERMQRAIRLIDETGLHTSCIERALGVVAPGATESDASDKGSTEIASTKAEYDRLRNRMVSANLRLAVSVAKKYLGSGVPLIDLVQEGSEGLMRAAEKFEPDRGFKFSTYAVWWIRQRISSAATQKSRVIRMSDSCMKRLQSLIREADEQSGRSQQSISFEQLSTESSNDSRRRDLRRAFYASREILSLDSPLGHDDSLTADKLVEEKGLDMTDELVRDEQRSMVLRALTRLTTREAQVVALRFGLGENSEHSLSEAGKTLALSRERVRQLERRALQKLEQHFAHEESTATVARLAN